MSRITVGSGKTFATINGATGDAGTVDGDTIQIFDSLTENVVSNSKILYFEGQVANRGVKITSSSGSTFDFETTGGNGSTVKNLHIDSTGGLVAFRASRSCAVDCLFTGDAGDASWSIFGLTGSTNSAFNCAARNVTVGGGFRMALNYLVFCTASDCVTGFKTADGNTRMYFCLAGNCTTDFDTAAGEQVHCVSEDGTAPGVAAVTGFLTSDWVNLNSDLQIKASVKATTKALIADTPPLAGTPDNDAFSNTRKTTGGVFAGFHDPDPLVAVVPGKPAMGTLVPATTQVTIPVTVANAGDEVFARFRPDGTEVWSVESAPFSRIGNGNIVVTGLTDDIRHEFGIYAKSGDLTSDWDTAFAIPTAGVTAATTKLAAMLAAVNTILVASTNLTDWIQTVNAGETTAGHVFLGYDPRSIQKSLETDGPFAFISIAGHEAVNAESAGLYSERVIVRIDFHWFRNHRATSTDITELNFISDIMDEFKAKGIALDPTFGGMVEDIRSTDLIDHTISNERTVIVTSYDINILFPQDKA